MNPSMLAMIRNFFATQPVNKAWIFGSYARGEQTDDSDVDILVDFDHAHAQIGLMEYVRMQRTLSDLLNKDVDLVEDGTLLPGIATSANLDKQLIYAREN